MAIEEVGLRLNLSGRAETAKGLRDTDADIAKLGNTATTTGDKLSRGLGAVEEGGRRVAAGIRAAILAGGATAAVAATSLVRVGIGYNTLEQTSRAALTTLLGTKGAADSMMNSVRDFGKTSPFPRQAFISATQQLLGFGFSASSIIPTLKTINDTTAALGGNASTIATIADVFASIKSQGKLSGDQVQRLGGLGINVLDILQKASGKSADAVQKAISAGAIKADDAIAVLTNGMNARFAGASDNVKTTWAGATDRVKGAWRDLGSELVKPFVDPRGGGAAVAWANGLADRIRKVQAAIPGIYARIATGQAAARNGGTGQLADPWERLGYWAGRAWLIISRVDWAGLGRRVSHAFNASSLGAFFRELTTKGSPAQGQLKSIGNSIGQLSPVFKALADNAPNLSEVLSATAKVLGFLARHVDQLVWLVPLLVGGFIAYRAALGTATVVAKALRAEQLLSTIGTWRSVTATHALARANLALAREQAIARGASAAEVAAMGRSALATGLARVRMVALRAATLAWSGVTKAAAAAQWLLNAAMSANPIALIIIGVIALVAGVIYAYKHFTWFHNAVDATWGAIKTAAMWLWKTVVPFTPLGLAIKGGIALVKEIKAHWSDFTDILGKAWDIIKKVGNALGFGMIAKAVGGIFGGGGGDDAAVAQYSDGPDMRATGGPVVPGQPYIVGEDRPELFIPSSPGVIAPHLPTQGGRAPAVATVTGAARSSGDLTVNLVVDSQVLGSAVLADFRARAARQ